MKTERLREFFKKSGRSFTKAGKNLAKFALKNPGRSLEIGAKMVLQQGPIFL